MPAFRHILFPVDFSERSKALRPYVKQVAQQFQAKLTLLNAVVVPPGVYAGMEGTYPELFDYESLSTQLRELLNNFFDPADRAAIKEFETVVESGDPVAVIVNYARAAGVDLIMMPTHGYGKYRSLLLGSVTAKVLHDAECAVWTATHSDAPELTKHLPCRNILAAVDLAEGQAGVIRRAAELAREWNATLRLVHAVPGAVKHPLETGGEEFHDFLLRSAREELEKLLGQAGVTGEILVEAGTVGEVVRQVALDRQADLVVIGRGVLHQVFGRLRTKSYEIIRMSPCPVLSF
jgi:nucleotide-binding universal stress UspA family protein